MVKKVRRSYKKKSYKSKRNAKKIRFSKRHRLYRKKAYKKKSKTYTMIATSKAAPLRNFVAEDIERAFGVPVDDGLTPSYDALRGMVGISDKLCNLMISPCCIDLSPGINGGMYNRLINTIIARNIRKYQPIGPANVDAGVRGKVTPQISWHGIKVKVIHMTDRLKQYIPIIGYQFFSQEGSNIAPFTSGKFYLKFPKALDPAIGVNIGKWPEQLVLGNIFTIKFKVYYSVLPRGNIRVIGDDINERYQTLRTTVNPSDIADASLWQSATDRIVRAQAGVVEAVARQVVPQIFQAQAPLIPPPPNRPPPPPPQQ